MRKNYVRKFYALHLDIVKSIVDMMKEHTVSEVDLSDDGPTIYGDILNTGGVQELVVYKVSLSDKGELMLDVAEYSADDDEIVGDFETVPAMDSAFVFRGEKFASVYDAVHGRLFE